MKISVGRRSKGEPKATPSTWLQIFLLKIKPLCDLGKGKSFLGFLYLVMFILRLLLKMRFIAISMASSSGLLVKRLITS